MTEEDLSFYSIKEFAEKLRVHPNTIRNGIKDGRIVAFKIGKGKRSMFRIAHSEIERMILLDLKFFNEENIDG